VAEQLRQQEPGREVTFSLQPGLMAQGDARLLRVLMENLLGNAWKFTSKRSGAHIEFFAETVRGVTHYAVRDNGVGFDMAYANKLFARGQPVRTLVGDAGPHLTLEAGDPHHEEFIEVVGRDRKEPDLLEQRMLRIFGLFQHAAIEMQPGQLAVDESLRAGSQVGTRFGDSLPRFHELRRFFL